MDLQSSSDDVLIDRARQGDRDAFGALVKRYQAQATLIAQSILRNLELAKDASQNAFAKAYFGLNHFRGRAQFKTWLFRIVINEARDTYRKEKLRGMFRFLPASQVADEEAESVLEIIPSGGESPRQAYEAGEIRKQLEAAIYRLPEREKEVFMLRYFNDLQLSEVAEALGISVGTVKSHLAQGTEKLKSLLLKPAESH